MGFQWNVAYFCTTNSISNAKEFLFSFAIFLYTFCPISQLSLDRGSERSAGPQACPTGPVADGQCRDGWHQGSESDGIINLLLLLNRTETWRRDEATAETTMVGPEYFDRAVQQSRQLLRQGWTADLSQGRCGPVKAFYSKYGKNVWCNNSGGTRERTPTSGARR
ncbi:hypothetical protein niasHT_031561 [Heterodera trifolii]|uniref:Uncharacterized protein n=1 Tax=Heterodera trifolii TaxID=157864 RepID=A0ABD2IZH3_9BILA